MGYESRLLQQKEQKGMRIQVKTGARARLIAGGLVACAKSEANGDLLLADVLHMASHSFIEPVPLSLI
jgi:hypothetical protein